MKSKALVPNDRDRVYDYFRQELHSWPHFGQVITPLKPADFQIEFGGTRTRVVDIRSGDVAEFVNNELQISSLYDFTRRVVAGFPKRAVNLRIIWSNPFESVVCDLGSSGRVPVTIPPGKYQKGELFLQGVPAGYEFGSVIVQALRDVAIDVKDLEVINDLQYVSNRLEEPLPAVIVSSGTNGSLRDAECKFRIGNIGMLSIPPSLRTPWEKATQIGKLTGGNHIPRRLLEYCDYHGCELTPEVKRWHYRRAGMLTSLLVRLAAESCLEQRVLLESALYRGNPDFRMGYKEARQETESLQVTIL